MLTYHDHKVRTSVRKLVEFLLRSGDITTGSAVRADIGAMQEGSRLHRKIQKAQKASYRSEVPLSMEWERVCEKTGEEYKLVLEGRADGIYPEDGVDEDRPDGIYPQAGELEDRPGKIIIIDEIKCLYRDVTQITEAEPLHLAQARCYAFMYGADKDLSDMGIRITYCNIETEDLRYLYYTFSMKELEEWFGDLIRRYALWADYVVASRSDLKKSIREMEFPFAYRPGQKKMAAMVYRAIRDKNHLFLQAPTGTGKTISALYPALKLQGDDESDVIFYLTAKTITGTVAEDTLKILMGEKRNPPLKIHSVTITSRERICILEEPDCNPETCPRALGHYDRINQALYHLLTSHFLITRELVLDCAARFHVCPYELGFEAAAFAECVICDYNYVFDPHVNARGLFGETNRKRSVLLIDEAHNLPDRARSMYSADLRREELLFIRKSFHDKSSYLVKKVRNVLKKLSAMEKLEEAGPDDAGRAEDHSRRLSSELDTLRFPLIRLLDPLEEYLKDHAAFEDREQIVQIYFRLRHFYMIMDRKEEGYQIYSTGRKKTFTIHLYCVDPSSCIKEYLEQSRSAIFFSATLLPVHYFRQLLGGSMQIGAFSIPSPFDAGRRLLAVSNDVTSRYSMRGEDQYRRIISYLEYTVRERKGNYMVFFPSYEMLSACEGLAADSRILADCVLLIQNASMNEEERESFLAEFSVSRDQSLLGFCVLGSLFSEGIDLVGDRLIGVMIVGTGIPKICKEREIIRTFFDMHGKKGYDYAYRYPGINKVLQAAGRVIRSDGDRGFILLLDNRFLWRENQILLPEEWESYYEVSLGNWPRVLHDFWERQEGESDL